MLKQKQQLLLELVKRKGVIKSSDLLKFDIPRTYLSRLVKSGVLKKASRGIYVLLNGDVTEHQSTLEACTRVPHGIVCLLSALQFHGLTTEIPHQIWLGISPKARLPKVDYPPIRFVRFSGPALTKGITEHLIHGVKFKTTTPARTVVDCFKYRNKIGLNVALEALRDCLRKHKATVDEIHQISKIRHMENVMRPYMEAIV
jgi:predicted transcriptional regulator of viral defense system